MASRARAGSPWHEDSPHPGRKENIEPVNDTTPAVDLDDPEPENIAALRVAVDTAIEAHRGIARKFLSAIGREQKCSCGQTIYLVFNNNTKKTWPVTEDLVNHFTDCENRDQYRRPR